MLIGLPSRRELMQPFALTTRIQETSRGQALRACTRILTRRLPSVSALKA
jgi:hypothetical protein